MMAGEPIQPYSLCFLYLLNSQTEPSSLPKQAPLSAAPGPLPIVSSIPVALNIVVPGPTAVAGSRHC
jgi:hypothetical protein